MKKILPTLTAIITVVIIFTGCNPLFPLDKDQFDFEESVTIKIGEKLYNGEDFWIRLDEISEDSRSFDESDSLTGRVVMQFTVSSYHSVKTVSYSTENEHGVTIEFDDPPYSFLEVLFLTVENITPEPSDDETISDGDYNVVFNTLWPVN